MRIVELRRADFARLHARLSATPYPANRSLALISSIWNWAARSDEVVDADNPATAGRIERYRRNGRERYLTSEELGRLGDALRDSESVGLPYAVDDKPGAKHAPKAEHRRVKLDPFAVAAIRLLILTGARLHEILDAQWLQLDLERGVLFLADSKTGRKPIYLSAAAQAVLASIPRLGGTRISSQALARAHRAPTEQAVASHPKGGKSQSLRIHDLRHTFASFGAGASLGLPIIGKLLGHSQAATTHRYAHLDADPMRRAVETIGAEISAAMDGRKSKNVISVGQ